METSKSWGRKHNLGLAIVCFAGLWCVFVAYVSFEPRPPRVPGISGTVSSAASHFAVYGVLTLWVYLAVRAWLNRGVYGAASIALLASTALGLTIEVLQPVFTDVRAFQQRDAAANLFGSALACLAVVALDSRGASLRWLAVLASSASVVSVLAAVVIVRLWDPGYPYPGDHWHAGYAVIICGQAQPLFPAFVGGIHSHGTDAFIHIHPVSDSDSGRKANLGRFFALAGGEIAADSVMVPGLGTYRNGDLCPDGGPGRLTVHRFDTVSRVRTRQVRNPASYVPRNGETLIVEFASTPFDFQSRQ